MPTALTYPGVYIEELPSGVHTIAGVATSITAFIGSAPRGPTDEPVRVQSFAEFDRAFGGLWVQSTLGYAVSQFFLNGGGDALIVRVASAGAAAKVTVGGLRLIAAKTGEAPNSWTAVISKASTDVVADPHPNLFMLTIENGAAAVKSFDNLSLDPGPPATPNLDFVTTRLAGSANAHVDPNEPPPSVPAIRPPNNDGASDHPPQFAGGKEAAVAATGALGTFKLVAASVGKWGQALRFRVDKVGAKFNLSIRDSNTKVTEKFLNLSTDPNDARFVTTVLDQQSQLVRVSGAVPNPLTTFSNPAAAGIDPLLDDTTLTAFTGKATDDGAAIADNDISLPNLANTKHGLWALEKADLFNLLCIPPLTFDIDINATTRTAAAAYCKQRRAMFLVDPLMAWKTPADLLSELQSPEQGHRRHRFRHGAQRERCAVLPLHPFAGSVAGEPAGNLRAVRRGGGRHARTDTQRGVWKAPAGIEATLRGRAARCRSS